MSSEALELGELLAVVASEASEHPFVGSDRQKEAWDEIKRRVARLEQERNEWKQAAECVPTSWADLYGREHELREAAVAAFAVAREREQRLREAAAALAAHFTGDDVLAEDAADDVQAVRAALVDEPAADKSAVVWSEPRQDFPGGRIYRDGLATGTPGAAADEPGETPGMSREIPLAFVLETAAQSGHPHVEYTHRCDVTLFGAEMWSLWGRSAGEAESAAEFEIRARVTERLRGFPLRPRGGVSPSGREQP